MKDQPDEGFAGPGKALLWVNAHADYGPATIGTSLFIVRADGARPKVNSKRPRTFVAV